MKVILSRKGFDQEYGGGPSPILDGERLVSLPIPYKKEKRRRFKDLRFEGKNLGKLIEQLHPKRSAEEFCHLDPDLRQDILPGRIRNKHWQPLFGQQGKVASHLSNQQVGAGDLFLFFGFFQASDGWDRFQRDQPELHVIHGWFQVDEVISNPISWAAQRENSWARKHPHCYGDQWDYPNLLFTARRYLQIPTKRGWGTTQCPGAGIFQNYNEGLVLSDRSHKDKSRWCVPECLRPKPKLGRNISCLGNARWRKVQNRKLVRIDPGKITLWQEAVITGNPEAAQWAVDLIKELA